MSETQKKADGVSADGVSAVASNNQGRQEMKYDVMPYQPGPEGHPHKADRLDAVVRLPMDRRIEMRGYSCIGLDDPKTDINVGHVLRAAGVFRADLVAIAGHRYSRSCTDTMKAHRHVPLLQVDDLHDVIPYDCVPVAVELIDGAVSLTHYRHPERALYVFGAEDATLGNRVLSWCRDVIYIPTNGCLNLSACVNVVLYDRLCKSNKQINSTASVSVASGVGKEADNEM